MTSSDNCEYMFRVKYPTDPEDEKEWTSFLEQVRNHPVSDHAKGKVLSLYLAGPDTYAFIMLIDGKQLSRAMAAQLSKQNYKQLPIEGDMDATETTYKWSIFEQDIMVGGKKDCWELFMGDINSYMEQYHYIYGSYDEAQTAFKAGHDANPAYNAYILYHYFEDGKSTSTTRYEPLIMPQ